MPPTGGERPDRPKLFRSSTTSGDRSLRSPRFADSDGIGAAMALAAKLARKIEDEKYMARISERIQKVFGTWKARKRRGNLLP
jgi:hypothetical protein